MKIFVRAKSGASVPSVEPVDATHLIVAVREPPLHGLANKAIARVLAEYFGCSLSQVSLLTGFSSRNKIFEIS